jgi:hypothetical protein
MAISIQTIAACLNSFEWRYTQDVEKSVIHTGIKAENVENFQIMIQVAEEGEFLQIWVPQLLQVKDHVFKGVLFQTLLHISYQTKLLRFEYDPSDGEVRVSIEIPIEDGNFTERQLWRCLQALAFVDRQVMPRLQAVLAYGEDPGKEDDLSSMAQGLLDQLPPEMVDTLARVLAERQQMGGA